MNRLAVALATTMAAAGIAAQASRPSKPGPSDVHGIRMDALSRKTLDRWQKLEYHLGRAGIDKLSMTIHFENDGSLGKHKVDGTYKFDGDKSTLAWKDTKMTGMLAERGLTVQMFERWIKPEGIRPELKDTKLTATPVDGGVKIAVDGKTTAGYRAFTFGADGVARSITLCGDEGEPESTIDLTYERVGTRHRASGWTSEFTHGGKAIRC
ncbi:MAG: hypothetical protein KDC87_21310, partial [Planctomycetes bacterium]|nr:hypothetical protein [Planctomycetota bacterium]